MQALVSSGGDVNKCDKYGQSPIYVAARIGRKECVQALVSSGGDVGTEIEPLPVGVPGNHSTLVCCGLSFDDHLLMKITGGCPAFSPVRSHCSLRSSAGDDRGCLQPSRAC